MNIWIRSFKIYSKWLVQASKHTHTRVQCSHSNVGLAQARPKYYHSLEKEHPSRTFTSCQRQNGPSDWKHLLLWTSVVSQSQDSCAFCVIVWPCVTIADKCGWIILVTKDHFCLGLLCACGCLTCEFVNLLPCVILIAAKDWKKNQCICYCVECSDRLHAGKSHHEILPVESAVFVMWGVDSFLSCSANWLGCGINWCKTVLVDIFFELWYKLIRM